MKIVHVVCTYPPYKGGMGNSVHGMIKSVKTEMADVITPEYKKIEKNCNERVLRLKPFFSFGNAALLPQLVWMLSRYDVVHLHYPFFGGAEFVLVAKLLRGARMRLFVHYHMDAKSSGLRGAIFALYRLFVLPFLLRVARKITCASYGYIKASEIGWYLVKKPDKFCEVSFGVDALKFRPTGRVQDDKKRILFVGGLDRAHYFKGLNVLIGAVGDLKEEDFVLVIVGNGELRGEYEEMARELGLKNKIEFLAGLDDDGLVREYNKADVFVLPSINKCEAFGLVLLEAMACEVPVIASRLPGVDGVFEDAKHGYYVNPGDEKDLREKIEMVLSEDERARKMGKSGRELVLDKYSWERVGERLMGLYNNDD